MVGEGDLGSLPGWPKPWIWPFVLCKAGFSPLICEKLDTCGGREPPGLGRALGGAGRGLVVKDPWGEGVADGLSRLPPQALCEGQEQLLSPLPPLRRVTLMASCPRM